LRFSITVSPDCQVQYKPHIAETGATFWNISGALSAHYLMRPEPGAVMASSDLSV